MSQPASSSPAPRKRSRTKWYFLAAVLIVAGLVAAAVQSKKNKGAVVTVTVEKAVIKTIVETVSATGKIQPEVEVKIAPEIAGEIVEMPFREGAAVKKGDLLVSIRADTYRFQVEQQEASVASAKAASLDAKARLTKAEEDFRRSQDLYDKQLISDSDYIAATSARDVAQANYDSALASIRRADGALSQMRDQLTKAVIYSPIDGTVSSRTSEVGERVAGTGQYGGADIMRIADLSNMEVRVNINENDIVNVKVGDKAKVSIDAFPDRKFDAIVKEIGAAAKTTGMNTQDEVTNFMVKIRILEKNVPLRPGMSANADVETKTVENVVAVPIQSVTVRSRQETKTLEELASEREKKANEMKGEGAATAVNDKLQRQREAADRESLNRVAFVRQGDIVKMVPVETGLTDATHIEIKSGIKEGDEIVSGSFSAITRTLKDGMKVSLEKPKAAKK